LFSANRWEAVPDIERTLQNGTHIVCDRYSASGVAYSIAHGLDPLWCHETEIGLPDPDLVIYLAPASATARVAVETRDGYGTERYDTRACSRKKSPPHTRRWPSVPRNAPTRFGAESMPTRRSRPCAPRSGRLVNSLIVS
jgi:hypothetical protein